MIGFVGKCTLMNYDPLLEALYRAFHGTVEIGPRQPGRDIGCSDLFILNSNLAYFTCKILILHI